MKIRTVNTQNFKAFYTNIKIEPSDEQYKITNDISAKSRLVDPKYDSKTSLLGYLKAEYNMDLFADPSSDKKSVNLYISENVPATENDPYKRNTRLTFVGNYSSKNCFKTKDVYIQLDKMTGNSGTMFMNSLATIMAVITLISAPVLGIATLIKEKNTQNIENIVKQTTNALKEIPKDTLNLARKFK